MSPHLRGDNFRGLRAIEQERKAEDRCGRTINKRGAPSLNVPSVVKAKTRSTDSQQDQAMYISVMNVSISTASASKRRLENPLQSLVQPPRAPAAGGHAFRGLLSSGQATPN